MSINFFQYTESMSKVFTGKRYVMAIVLSKVSVTKTFKLRCLCYWLVDSPYLKNWLKHNQNIYNQNFFLEKQLGFSCMWILPTRIIKCSLWCELFSNYVLIIPYESIFIDKTWDWVLRKRCLKKLRSLPEKFQVFFQLFSKWTSDCLWAMAINRFLQQGSQDIWYFSIYMFTNIFFLRYFLLVENLTLNKSLCKTFQSYFSLISIVPYQR